MKLSAVLKNWHRNRKDSERCARLLTTHAPTRQLTHIIYLTTHRRVLKFISAAKVLQLGSRECKRSKGQGEQSRGLDGAKGEGALRLLLRRMIQSARGHGGSRGEGDLHQQLIRMDKYAQLAELKFLIEWEHVDAVRQIVNDCRKDSTGRWVHAQTLRATRGFHEICAIKLDSFLLDEALELSMLQDSTALLRLFFDHGASLGLYGFESMRQGNGRRHQKLRDLFAVRQQFSTPEFHAYLTSMHDHFKKMQNAELVQDGFKLLSKIYNSGNQVQSENGDFLSDLQSAFAATCGAEVAHFEEFKENAEFVLFVCVLLSFRSFGTAKIFLIRGAQNCPSGVLLYPLFAILLLRNLNQTLLLGSSSGRNLRNQISLVADNFENLATKILINAAESNSELILDSLEIAFPYLEQITTLDLLMKSNCSKVFDHEICCNQIVHSIEERFGKFSVHRLDRCILSKITESCCLNFGTRKQEKPMQSGEYINKYSSLMMCIFIDVLGAINLLLPTIYSQSKLFSEKVDFILAPIFGSIIWCMFRSPLLVAFIVLEEMMYYNTVLPLSDALPSATIAWAIVFRDGGNDSDEQAKDTEADESQQSKPVDWFVLSVVAHLLMALLLTYLLLMHSSENKSAIDDILEYIVLALSLMGSAFVEWFFKTDWKDRQGEQSDSRQRHELRMVVIRKFQKRLQTFQ